MGGRSVGGDPSTEGSPRLSSLTGGQAAIGAMRVLLRQAAVMVARLGMVLLLLAALVRIIPTLTPAAAVADDLAIAVSVAVVAAAAAYLFVTREV